MRESEIEKHLVDSVKALGGETRKVKWIGRMKAPDRVVMLPFKKPDGTYFFAGFQTIWVEVKRPGGLAKFPSNGHERGQAREHERMRRMGQRVVVIDSIEGVEELLNA